MNRIKKCFTSGSSLLDLFFCRIKSNDPLIMFRKSEAPAAERNKNPILEVLKDIIKVPENEEGFPYIKVLEISSGTGQHVTHFAKHLSPLIFWQPTEYDRSSFSSICAYIQENQLQNVAPPVYVDIREHHNKWNPVCGNAEKSASKVLPITEFKENSFDYIYNSNLIHISSFDCTEGLFFNSGKLLKKNGYLITYGPYGQNVEDTEMTKSDLLKAIEELRFDLKSYTPKCSIEIREAIKEKRRLRKQWQQTRYPPHKTEMNRAQKRLKIMIQEERDRQRSEFLDSVFSSVSGVITPESNVNFNRSLQLSDPSWGVRDIQNQLIPLAEKNNLKLIKIIDMPSNNKTLLWQKID